MSVRDTLRRAACLAGPLAVVLAWIVILAAWWLNRSWFIYTEHAFSDLGGPRSCCPGLYNIGLMLVAAAIAVFSLCVLSVESSKLGVLGAGYFVIAAIFLALIGVFPAGTRHHVCVSTWFFVQADMALALLTAHIYRVRRSLPWLLLFLAALLAWPVAILVELAVGWPSAAVLETYGIIIIDVASLGVFAYYWGLIRTRQ